MCQLKLEFPLCISGLDSTLIDGLMMLPLVAAAECSCFQEADNGSHRERYGAMDQGKFICDFFQQPFNAVYTMHNANNAKTFLKHFSDCLFYFCSTCADA